MTSSRPLDAQGCEDRERVELRIFGGSANEEIAEALAVPLATVGRDWPFARAWLSRDVREHAERGS